MNGRLAPLACFILLGSAGICMFSALHGQDGVPAAPVIKPAQVPTPPSASPPASTTPKPIPEALVGKNPAKDLERMSPLRRQMYLTAWCGANWLAERNDTNGHFEPGQNPALGMPIEGDHFLQQAGATFALARAARLFDEADYSARATHSLLRLLEETTIDPKNSAVRYSMMPPTVVNRLSSSALLVLTIAELPTPGDDLLRQADQLCEYIRTQQQANGSLRLSETDNALSDPAAQNTFPLQAIYAVLRSHARRPANWKLDLARKALPFYMAEWKKQKDRDLACWMTLAWTEAFAVCKDKAFADAVFTLNDWLCNLQHIQLNPRHPRRLGGFRDCVGGKELNDVETVDIGSALCTLSLSGACSVARKQADVARYDRYLAALERGLQFVTTLQYTSGDTQHFAEWYRKRLVGGFHASHDEGTLRIEYTQQALLALLHYLTLPQD